MNDRAKHETRESAPRSRYSGLATALLRIGASLELETVLQEVLDCACMLTGARYGAVTTIDEAGRPVDFVTSGLTEEEHRNMTEWPDGPKVFEHFRDLKGPLACPTRRSMSAH